MQPKILLIEDNPADKLVVVRTLGKDYSLTCVTSSEEAFPILNKESFELILLDIKLPDEDGFRICSRLKSQENTRDIPVFFLTGQFDPQDKVMGFSLGADDYIVKPFETSEFRARIAAKLKKQRASAAFTFSSGIFQFDANKQKAFISNGGTPKDLKLTAIEFRLLFHFLRHEDHVLSRQQLLQVLWGHDTHVTDRTVDSHIYTLRKKLGSYKNCIHSVHGIGYKFETSRNKKTA